MAAGEASHRPAPSSCALQLFVGGPTPGSHEPGSASGACFVGPRFPWSPALAPPTPPPVARLCSSASSLLCRNQTSLDRASADSGPHLPATDHPATTAPMADPEISRRRRWGFRPSRGKPAARARVRARLIGGKLTSYFEKDP